MCEPHETPIPGLELSGWSDPVGIFRTWDRRTGDARPNGYQSYRFLSYCGWRVAHIRRVRFGNSRIHYSVYAMHMRSSPCVVFDTYEGAEAYLDKMVRGRMMPEPKLWSVAP